MPGKLAVFVFGFAKNEQENIDDSDERDFKDLAKEVLSLDGERLTKLTDRGWEEVQYQEHDEEEDEKSCK